MKRRRSKKSLTEPRPSALRQKDIRRFELLGGAAVASAGILVVVMFLAASLQPYTLKIGQHAAVISAALVKLVNGDRVESGFAALTLSPRLTAVAQAKADDMAKGSYFAHTSPDGKDPWYWFAQEGYAFQYAGENLAVDFSDSIDVEQAWMNSPAHRKNILDPHYTQIGIATAVGEFEGRRTVFVVQAFGAPAPAQETIAASYVPNDPQTLALAAAETQAETTATRVLGAETETSAAPPETIGGDSLARSSIAQMISSPKNTLRYSYYLLGLFILLALAYRTRFEMKKHHIRHATAAGGLILLMGLLFIVAEYMIFTSPTISETSASIARSL